MLYKSRRLDIAISKNASFVILDRMIQGMTVSEKLDFFKRTTYEAQAMPHREMVLRKVKGFSGKLPQNRALQVMTNLIFRIYTAKNTGPFNLLMHTAGSGPSTTNSFEPAHPEVGIGASENILLLFKPLSLRNN